jgi:hypothetical protein
MNSTDSDGVVQLGRVLESLNVSNSLFGSSHFELFESLKYANGLHSSSSCVGCD